MGKVGFVRCLAFDVVVRANPLFQVKGICTLDDVSRERRRVLNTTLATFTISILFYLVWNYVVLEVAGIAVGLPWEDSAFWN